MASVDFSPIANMRPFRLDQAVAGGQGLALNQMRLSELQRGQQAREGLQQAVTAGTPEAMDDFRKRYPDVAMEWETKSTQYKGAALDFKLKQIDMLSRLAAGVEAVKDPAGKQAAYQRALGLAQELELDVSGAPPQYDPGWMQQVQTQILSAKDRVSMAKDAFDRQHKEREQTETERHNRAMERQRRTGRVRPPSRTQVLDARDLIRSDPDLARLPEESQDALAYNVAARVQQLMAEDDRLSASDAMAAALDEEMENVSPGESRSRFGFDALARDKPAEYRDPRRPPEPAAPGGLPTAPPAEPTGASGAPTQADLEFTAQKHGISVDEVKRRLGIR